MPTRLLLVDDHQMWREALCHMFDGQPDIDVAGQTGDAADAVRLAAELQPDLVLMDIDLGQMGGIEATRRIHAECPAAKIVAVSMHTEHEVVTDMLDTGANGYVVKDASFDELLGAIRAVAANGMYISPEVHGALVDSLRRQHREPPPHARARLTDRQREVLGLVADGLCTKQIARELNVSPKTIETHRRNLKEVLGIDNVAELTKYAVREGLSDLGT